MTDLWYAAAERVPATKPGVPFQVPLARVVHHITVSGDQSSMDLFHGTGYWPGWLVRPGGVEQHYPASLGGRALENDSGGVATNAFGCAQIEIINYPGKNMAKGTMDHLIDLLRWFRDEHNIPWVWPNGRPQKTNANHNRSVTGWKKTGHFGHSQVPENSHWDPAYTDYDWDLLMHAMVPPAPPTPVRTPVVIVEANSPEARLLDAYPTLFKRPVRVVPGSGAAAQNPLDVGFGVYCTGTKVNYLASDRNATLIAALKGEGLV